MDLFQHTTQAPRSRHGAGFWAVAFAFLAVMAFSTVPTPLYSLYQERDGFSTFLITVIFAAYGVGVIAALFLAGHVSDWLGRRRTLVPAVWLSIASAIVFLVWSDLPGLLLGRVLSGLSVGIVSATATAYLSELHAGHRPGTSPRRAQALATTANLGGLGLGPLVAGLVAQSSGAPLTLPFVVLLVALVIGAVAVALAPETVDVPDEAPAYRPQRVAVLADARGRFFAAAAGALASFAAFGLFTSLAPAFLAGLGHTSRALAGIPAFSAFEAAVVVQLVTTRWDVRPLLSRGMLALAAGLISIVVAVWVESLALFLVGGLVAGAGGGLLFKGGMTTVAGLAPEGRRAEVVAGFFLAGYVGLSVPVVGLGVLDEFMEPHVALLIFGVLLLAALAGSAWALLRGEPSGGGAGAQALPDYVDVPAGQAPPLVRAS